MANHRFQFTVDHMIGRHEVELVVTYSVTPFIEATYWQPAEGGEVEIQSIKHKGQPVTLSDGEEDAILAMAEARAADDMADETAAYADWQYQEHRDRLLMAQFERDHP